LHKNQEKFDFSAYNANEKSIKIKTSPIDSSKNTTLGVYTEKRTPEPQNAVS